MKRKHLMLWAAALFAAVIGININLGKDEPQSARTRNEPSSTSEDSHSGESLREKGNDSEMKFVIGRTDVTKPIDSRHNISPD